MRNKMKIIDNLSFKNVLGLSNNKYIPNPSEVVIPASKSREERPLKKEVLLEWVGLTKLPPTKKNEKFMRSLTIIAFVVLVLLVILQEFIPIVAILVVVFISYVIAAAPAEQVKYEITTLGFTYGGEFFPWDAFRYFFITQKEGYCMFNLDLHKDGVSRLFVLVSEDKAAQVQSLLNEYLPFLEKPPEDFADKIFKLFVSKINITSQSTSNS
jgi:hypothetical protein